MTEELTQAVIVYWVIVLLVLISYLNAACRNPGFVEKSSEEDAPDNVSGIRTQPCPEISMQMSNISKPKLEDISNDTMNNAPENETKSIASIINGQDTLSDERSNAPPNVSFQEIPEEDSARESSSSDIHDIGSLTDPARMASLYSQSDYSQSGFGEYESGVISVDSEVPSTSEIIVERRWCTAWAMEQPIRAKHWKDWGRCVMLHDHHCPWLGTCVGQYNRCFFYWYVVLQTIELWWTLIWAFSPYDEKSFAELLLGWIFAIIIRILSSVVLGFFTLLVTALFAFHTYLAIVNNTTWEVVSWGRISYLHNWPRASGSPFDRGVCNNLLYYCTSCLKRYVNWRVPERLPERARKHFICC